MTSAKNLTFEAINSLLHWKYLHTYRHFSNAQKNKILTPGIYFCQLCLLGNSLVLGEFNPQYPAKPNIMHPSKYTQICLSISTNIELLSLSNIEIIYFSCSWQTKTNRFLRKTKTKPSYLYCLFAWWVGRGKMGFS